MAASYAYMNFCQLQTPSSHSIKGGKVLIKPGTTFGKVELKGQDYMVTVVNETKRTLSLEKTAYAKSAMASINLGYDGVVVSKACRILFLVLPWKDAIEVKMGLE